MRATVNDLKHDHDEAREINSVLFNASVVFEQGSSGRETYYDSMTQDDIDAWYAWDRAWIENESVREMYAGLIALEQL